MLFERKEFKLKNGETAVFRSPETGDAAEMLEYLRVCSSETPYIIRYPEEVTETTEQEADFLERIIKSDFQVMIVCTVNGEIAGNCQLIFGNRMKTRHRAEIAIGLMSKYWNLGIGTAMFREMISMAEERGLCQLQLEYIEGNERALRLYNKMGFSTVAEKHDAFRLKDGTFRKEICMVKKL